MSFICAILTYFFQKNCLKILIPLPHSKIFTPDSIQTNEDYLTAFSVIEHFTKLSSCLQGSINDTSVLLQITKILKNLKNCYV